MGKICAIDIHIKSSMLVYLDTAKCELRLVEVLHSPANCSTLIKHCNLEKGFDLAVTEAGDVFITFPDDGLINVISMAGKVPKLRARARRSGSRLSKCALESVDIRYLDDEDSIHPQITTPTGIAADEIDEYTHIIHTTHIHTHVHTCIHACMYIHMCVHACMCALHMFYRSLWIVDNDRIWNAIINADPTTLLAKVAITVDIDTHGSTRCIALPPGHVAVVIAFTTVHTPNFTHNVHTHGYAHR